MDTFRSGSTREAAANFQCMLIFIALVKALELFIEYTGETTEGSSNGSY